MKVVPLTQAGCPTLDLAKNLAATSFRAVAAATEMAGGPHLDSEMGETMNPNPLAEGSWPRRR